MRAALSLPARGRLRPWTYHRLFGLLSVTGLRLGEASNLELQDVDLKTGVLTIRSGKFGKSRLIPLHLSTRRVLADYLARRNRQWARRAVSSYLLVSNWGNQLDRGEIHRTFYALSRQIGLRGPSDSHGPGIHDLRHRFAGMTLLRWYRSGEDFERKLPYLSAYLGHVDDPARTVIISVSPAPDVLASIVLPDWLTSVKPPFPITPVPSMVLLTLVRFRLAAFCSIEAAPDSLPL